MNSKRNRVLVVATVGVLAVMAAGCSTTNASGGSKRDPDKVVNLAVNGTLDTLDATVSSSEETLANIYDALVTNDPQGQPQLSLATSYTHSADNRTWTYHLRNGVKFQDGGALTSADVKFTYMTVKGDETSRRHAFTTNLKSVGTPDAKTVVFNLDKPAVWQSSGAGMWVVSKAAYQKMGPKQFAKTPVGSGPYEVKKILPGPKIVLKAFDGYWKGAPR